jgi:tRNA threonylcarbamoyladenosine biosynthesis protein TsaE
MTQLTARSVSETHDIGQRVGALLQAGDVVILDGPLGAGKTTFTQGIAQGLGVRGPITSPTFVIARIHPSLIGGPALVHVDAYRVNSLAEIDDLDMDGDLNNSVVVAEWGIGKVEQLVESPIRISITRADDETRMFTIEGLEVGC